MYKLYLIVRTDREFSRGKLIVHGGHAATVITEQLLSSDIVADARKFYNWFEEGKEQSKIVLKEHGLEDIMYYYDKAKFKQLPCCCVEDAGYKEVTPDTIIMVGILANEEEAKRLGLKQLKLFE